MIKVLPFMGQTGDENPGYGDLSNARLAPATPFCCVNRNIAGGNCQRENGRVRICPGHYAVWGFPARAVEGAGPDRIVGVDGPGQLLLPLRGNSPSPRIDLRKQAGRPDAAPYDVRPDDPLFWPPCLKGAGTANGVRRDWGIHNSTPAVAVMFCIPPSARKLAATSL